MLFSFSLIDTRIFIITNTFSAHGMWCSNRETDGFPKELIPGFSAEKRPNPPVTPSPRYEDSYDFVSSGMSNLPTYSLMTSFVLAIRQILF